ncbi:glycosyltransferase family 2 protein [Geitlerinema sp. PCC 7407]|uniref:glycosyltransferase n=1 Tax=Geitlerinema sp. PCC 7407 TaxID=1173025 RepID=UPI00029FAC38|nr:glycosyltransferase family 2 protein [Geitlerinema sp. PCC 7407]AFY65174.1 glycosyl transferase family 2 [Geitlerinema sp. PCC 7407]
MPENSWPENGSSSELNSVNTLFTDWSPEDFEGNYNPSSAGRRRKAAVTLAVVWSITVALHWLSWGSWVVWGLTLVTGIHALRVLAARPGALPEPLSAQIKPESLPYVSLLVAAKNEEGVVTRLVRHLCSLDYPASRYDLWVINDNSADRTGALLDELARSHPQLKVIHRGAEASGGKSGALNQAWPQTRGDVVAVFDADAQVPKDLLRRVLPMFERPKVGAVQVRKAIANATANFWTRGQAAEMALDTFFQQQRIALGGIGELRGNGQFIRRQALQSCGGFNEETITDDLDLTVRLHLESWDLESLSYPAVEEEGVTGPVALWHQRNRWAEGGYQRYLDYWRPLVWNRLGFNKTLDLLMFWLIQYILPTAALPDLTLAIARHTSPVLAPLTGMTVGLSLMGMYVGLRRIQRQQASISPLWRSRLRAAGQTLLGTVYMFHWLVVIGSTTVRMSIRPKRLKWVKTVHYGAQEEWADAPGGVS